MSKKTFLQALQDVAEANRDYTDNALSSPSYSPTGSIGEDIDLTKVSVFILDVLNDDVTVTHGGVDQMKRRITT